MIIQVHACAPRAVQVQNEVTQMSACAVCAVQVHDEVILEGPKDTAQQAKDLVVKHMAHPWAWAAKVITTVIYESRKERGKKGMAHPRAWAAEVMTRMTRKSRKRIGASMGLAC